MSPVTDKISAEYFNGLLLLKNIRSTV